MKVNLFVSRDIDEPHADIHTDELTDNISKAINILESEDQNDMLAVRDGSDITLLELKEIYMFRVEDKKVMVYTDNEDYLIKKPLYQVEEGLNDDLINLFFGCIVAGWGFSLTGLIYEREDLPLPFQIIFQMGIGMSVLFFSCNILKMDAY